MAVISIRAMTGVDPIPGGHVFPFGTQPSVTQQHLGALPEGRFSRNRLFWVLLGDLRCRLWPTENPCRWFDSAPGHHTI